MSHLPCYCKHGAPIMAHCTGCCKEKMDALRARIAELEAERLALARLVNAEKDYIDDDLYEEELSLAAEIIDAEIRREVAEVTSEKR